MTPQWSPATKYIAGIAMVVLTIYTLFLSSSVIPLLIIAGLIAVMVRPIINWIQHRTNIPLTAAVAIVYIGLIFIVPIIIILLVPAMIDAFRYILAVDYTSIIQGIIQWAFDTLAAIKRLPMPNSDIDAYVDQSVDAFSAELRRSVTATTVDLPAMSSILQSLQTTLSTTFGAAAGLIGNVFSTVILIIFVFLASVYMSLEAHTYRHNFLRLVPTDYQHEINHLLDRIGNMWNSFFRGQITLMIIIGVMSWIGLSILGVPGAISLAIVAGVLELIPNLGPIIATIPAVIVALLQGSTYLPVSPLVLAIIVLIFYLLVQQLENSLIVPRVLGDAVGLPALVVMTGVLVGTIAGGILGALLATPIIATMREILAYIYAKMMDQEPFPDIAPVDPPPPLHQSLAQLYDRIRQWWWKRTASH